MKQNTKPNMWNCLQMEVEEDVCYLWARFKRRFNSTNLPKAGYLRRPGEIKHTPLTSLPGPFCVQPSLDKELNTTSTYEDGVNRRCLLKVSLGPSEA